MRHPLKTIDWRLERAEEHLTTLDRERRSFLDDEDRRIVGEFDRDAGEYVFSHTGAPLDPRLGLRVGEFAHHLRAALDNLVWQLVLLRGGSPTSKTQFPIYESRERYLSSLWMLRGVSADDRAVIEQCQPFQAGEEAPNAWLALLAWTNNLDKHRLLHVGCSLPLQFPIRVSYGEEGIDAGYFPWNPRPIRDIRKFLEAPYVPIVTDENRTELLRVKIEPSGPNPEMEMDTQATIEVALSDAKHRLILTDLRAMNGVVRSIVEAFRPRFDI